MKKITGLIVVIALAAGGIFVYPKAKLYFTGTSMINVSETLDYFVKTGTSLEELAQDLLDQQIIENKQEFVDYARARNLTNSTLEPGKYVIKKNSHLSDVVTNFRKGYGEKEVKITFNNARTLENISEKITLNIELTKEEFLAKLNHPEVQVKYGFNAHTIRSLFIPNTYNVYWDITSDELIARMAKEYKAFWNPNRIAKAKKIGLSQSEVSTLASIVYTETNKMDDADKIAGVYMNRIKRGIPLQADPTLIFAKGDFSIRRVLNEDKLIDSPYNTYKYAGLPPGPIYVSPIPYLDAVLNYEKHDYVYFCAKEDFSGYSNFAKTLQQHNINARKYQNALNKRKTYR